MSIRIDRETGAIVGSDFVIRPGLRRGMLKTIQPRMFERLDAGRIRVAEDGFDNHIVTVYAIERDGSIVAYDITVHDEGDSWDNWTSEKMEAYRRAYHAILLASGIGGKEPFSWGHAEVFFDAKNVIYSLWVVHRASPI